MITDEIVEEVRRVREELIAKYGGFDGWMDHLQEMDRQRIAKAKRASKKKPANGATKTQRRSAKPKS